MFKKFFQQTAAKVLIDFSSCIKAFENKPFGQVTEVPIIIPYSII